MYSFEEEKYLNELQPSLRKSSNLSLNSSLKASDKIEKTHRCTYEGCGKAYSSNSRLEIHIRTHVSKNNILIKI